MKRIAKILVAAFILNFFWEIGQASLYAPHFEGVSGLIQVHLWASLGDVILVFLILLLDIFLFRQLFSKEKLNWRRAALVMVSGLVMGVAVERIALLTGRWTYSDFMPIIPILKVGLAPVLQMTLLPALAIFMCITKDFYCGIIKAENKN